MTVKVIERFNDKNTKEFYKLNQEIEVSKERYEEIKQLVEIVKNKTFEESVKKSTRRKG